MANTIKLKNSGTASAAPTSLEYGELGLNYADGKIFYKNSSNTIVQFSAPSAGASNYVVNGRLTQDQTVSSNSDLIVPFVDDFDPNNWWNATDKKFIPTIAGYYNISFQVWWSVAGIATNQNNIQIRKNGDTVAISQTQLFTGSGYSQNVTKLVYLNGSTDYIQFSAFSGNSSSQLLQYGGSSNGSGTFFSASLVTVGKGDTGDTGATGATGAAGATGATGPEGGTSTLTTKGDILTRSSSAVARLGVGADNYILRANSTTTTGLDWVNGSTTINGTAIAIGSSGTVTANANTLTGTSLASGVTGSSLTSVGTIGTGVWQGTVIGVLYGGTGSTTASGARTALGLAIGSNVQAYNSLLDAVSANTYTGSSSITTVGTITTGTWSGSFGAVSGANLTSLTAGNLSGTIPSAVLGNSSHFIGTTSIALNRASASQTLNGVSVSGSARDSEIRFYMEVV